MIKKPNNINYCATVIEVKNLLPLDNCDNLQHINVGGNLVIVDKSVKVGDIGLFFPPETQLSNDFLKYNNLYRKPELNIDKEKKGYFEENGRIRTIKLRGNKSMGLFIPLSSLDFINHKELLHVGNEFDELNGIKICEKYVLKTRNTTGNKGNKKAVKGLSKLVDNQVKFHIDTPNINKVFWKIKPDSLISITRKLHGSSFTSHNILVKRKLNIFEKILKKIGIKIQDTEYDNIYTSRKVIKNQYYNDKDIKNFYDIDIWGLANNRIKDTLFKSMSYFGEIVGYLPNGGYIQKDYDYGCDPGTFDIYIYRITSTNVDGKVVEWSAKMVQLWCKLNGLKAVPELYYGYAKDLFRAMEKNESLENWQNALLEFLIENFTDKDCNICKNKVPEEGVVIRLDDSLDIDVMKMKSYRFLERETKDLDKGEKNIEDEN